MRCPTSQGRMSLRAGVPLLAISALAIAGMPATAKAHDWYPQECCNDMDCAVVTELKYLSGGTLKVTTTRGTVEVSRDFPIRPSLDRNAHACLAYGEHDLPDGGWRLMCLFLPTGATLTPSLITPGPVLSQIAAITQRKGGQ
jgi:hypothetical protein